MTLIKSISGIRGTIGGNVGKNLTPLDVVRYTAAYGQWVLNGQLPPKVVVGRDARTSGSMVSQLVCNTLTAQGINVLDIGLTTTPTVEIAVPKENAGGGIIITASHNPAEWNALKLLNARGEFLSHADGGEILTIADKDEFHFVGHQDIGTITHKDGYLQMHIDDIMALDLVDTDAIKACNFKVAVDGVNSTGGTAVPALLKALGIQNIHEIYCNPNGQFPHNPEPLPENLKDISEMMQQGHFNVGFVVDPDVDRLAILDENGQSIGEEYTLVLVADYVLSHKPGDVVSNLSSSGALTKIAHKHHRTRDEAAVGEVNVVHKMKETGAVIGGEGNGGVIYPELHYGRDALVGIALFLTHLAKSQSTVSQLFAESPKTYIAKNKVSLPENLDVDELLGKVQREFDAYPQSTIDGLKIYFDEDWAHIRKSNTEPIIRIYTESDSRESANSLFQKINLVIDSLN